MAKKTASKTVTRLTPQSKETAVIIIPTYNERANITRLIPLIEQVRRRVTTWKLDVLVVDDSSPDGTADAVRELQKEYPFVHLLVNKNKSGLGGAYLKGMAEAFNNLDADVVFEFDADLSHDPKKIPEFLQALDAGADMVLGSRYIQGGSIPSNWGLHRKFLSVFGNVVISLILTSVAVRDWTTGYRAIRRSVYEAVHASMEENEQFTGYTFQIGFLHKTIRHGFKVKEVPFHFIDRTVGESKLGTEYIVNTLKYLVTVRAKELMSSRLFKFLVVGGVGFMVNFIFYNLFKQFTLWSGFLDLVPGLAQQAWTQWLLSDQSLAVMLSAEVAILSNYTLNNVWTFRDRKINGILAHVRKFLQFNVGSMGSIAIQYFVMQAAVRTIGVFTLVTLFGISLGIDNVYLAVGVLVGMIWNFTIYNKVIWRKSK